MKMARGRYAPSPTGALHVGNARTALLSWLQIRSIKGQFILRIEDLDRQRTVANGVEALLEDLKWLGLDWDEGPDLGGPCPPYLQSERETIYENAIAKLARQGLVYECFCSRTEIAAAALAPHGPADDGPQYSGACSSLDAEQASAHRALRAPALRFRVAPGVIEFIDGVRGVVGIDVSQSVGDFVIRRIDGIHAYQLAVAVDDALMGVTHVLRGDDLMTSTPRQIAILRALGLETPRYFHVPLLLGADGQRLSKRKGDINIAWLRARGVRPQRIVGELARSCGLSHEIEIEPKELIQEFNLTAISKEAAPFDPSRLG